MMIHNEINKMLAAAMKERNADLLYVLKMIKAKFLEFQTSKGFKEEDFTEAKEMSIIKKMEKSWDDELQTFKSAGRDVSELENRLNILRTFLPKEVSEEEIKQCMIDSGIELVLKNMRSIMTYVQEKYPSVTGKQISTIINSFYSS